jgi:NAD(P)-dependent dehydrogenase (short-subunit alcohol dehydrogenase family)
VTCDLTDEAQTARMLAELGTRLDVLINNAGIEARAVSGTAGFGADWRRVMSVNLDGAAYLSQAALPLLERAQGCIINIASIQAHAVLHTANTVYSVSKAALAQLTRAMAVEYAPRGVRVNAIAPGVVETPMIRQAGMDADRFRLFLDRIPMKRFALAEEIFGPAQFLASSGAGYVTGIILPVDGGFLAM